MGNQQGKVSDLEVAWLAGFLDGEGSFMAKIDRRGGRVYYNPRITVANTNEPTLEVVTSILDRCGLPYHIERRQYTNPRWSPAWSITVSGMKRCARWLVVLSPFLKTKHPQAVAMSDFITLRLSGHEYGAEYTAKELVLIGYLRDQRHPHRPHADAA